MKIAFVTELPLNGKVPDNYPNMRTEFAWMHSLGANHFNIGRYEDVTDYDHVFVIFPKGEVHLNAVGSKLIDRQNPASVLLRLDFINKLKEKNKKVHFVQEGPHWLWNDYEVADQIYYYNMIASCDSIFCHNETDSLYYKGLFQNKPVNTIQSLMIEDLIKDIVPSRQNKTVIGGNFARWYGGFESYMIADVFNNPIWTQTSHATRIGEPLISNINHFPRVNWIDWMKSLSSFTYAVHLMPTVAAGTFSLNCAYFGIPCIGNRNVDTQKLCHPSLSVDVHDIKAARELALELKNNQSFYNDCSYQAKINYTKHYSLNVWKNRMDKILSE